MVPIYIGYDPREAIAYHVCVQSIIENCSQPDLLEFHPLRGERRDGSNDFIYARFLVPQREDFLGHAIFLDGDMIVRGDIMDLWNMRSHYHGVQVVKHPDYETKHPVKYLGNANDDYPRKNWSSVILWNCNYMPNRRLSQSYIRKATGAHLHRFEWLRDDQIGELPEEWNRLVMEQPSKEGDKLLHYTIGLPAFREYAACDQADKWWDVYGRTIAPL